MPDVEASFEFVSEVVTSAFGTEVLALDLIHGGVQRVEEFVWGHAENSWALLPWMWVGLWR